MVQSYRRKKMLNPRKMFWKILRSFQAVGSMPSWALPIETITAWMFLGERKKNGRSGKSYDR